MDTERLREAFRLFDRLVDVPPERWVDELIVLCPDDAQVRAEALLMLEADAKTAESTGLVGRAPDLLAHIAQAHEASTNAQLTGQRVGSWLLLHELGRGGMGAVWLAERADGSFDQKVAIKLIRPGWDADEVLGRFRAERQILAGLHHPNIARLVDGGVTQEGKPWLALEYVDGVNLRAYCETHTLSVPARLKLLLTVCEAVAYAHARLIVHRDLKPSNILVTADGQVKLLDFGIAKLLDSDAAAITGTRVFTPEYAAPEQVRGDPITTAVDIYTLGRLAYELLTGTSPYRLDRTKPAGYERAVLEQEPARPSHAVTRRPSEQIEAATLRRALRGDLDAIVLKAMRKEPEQRYVSVNAFAADIQAYLEQRPVAARRGGTRYRMLRFVRRHAIAVVLGTATVLALVGGLSAALWQRDIARTEAKTAEQVVGFLTRLLSSATPDAGRGRDLTVKEVVASGAERIQSELADEPQVQVRLQMLLADVLGVLGDNDDADILYEKALTTERKLHGEYSVEVARIYDQQADLRKSQNRFAEHERLSRLAYDRLRATLGDDHEETIWQYNNIGSALYAQGRYSEALPYYRDATEHYRAGHPQDSRALANMLGNTGKVLEQVGELDASERYLRDALDMRRRLFGNPHSHVAYSLHLLATLMVTRERYEDAYRYSSEAREQYVKLYADNTERTALEDHLRGSALALQGQLEAAEPLLRHSLAILIREDGADDETVAAARASLGDVLRLTGRFDEAREQYELALATYRKLYPGDVAERADPLLGMGELALARSAATASCENFEEALRLRRDLLSATSWKVDVARIALAYCQTVHGDAQSEARMRAALTDLAAKRRDDDFTLTLWRRRMDDISTRSKVSVVPES